MKKAIFILLCMVASLNASAWKLIWDEGVDKSSCAEFSGNRINYGTQSGTYTEHVNAGNVLEYDISSLPLNQNYITYFFVVNAYKLDDSECSTATSNEVAWTTGVLSTPTPPTGIIVASLFQDILVRAKIHTEDSGETTYFIATDTKSLTQAKVFRNQFERVESGNPAIVTTKQLRAKLAGVVLDNDEVIYFNSDNKVIYDDRNSLGIKKVMLFNESVIINSDRVKHVLLNK